MPSTLFQPDLQGLSRRDFLKLSGVGLVSLLHLPRLSFPSAPSTAADLNLPCQGRVLEALVNRQVQPSLAARTLESLRRDQVCTILSATLGDENPPYNRVWYEIEGGGYIHSAGLLPMSPHNNPPATSLPAKGLPAEVTVPFTDAQWSVNPPGVFAYRLYYGAVLWVDRIVQDEKGQSWYRIADEGQQPVYYFADAAALHLVTEDEVAPISPALPADAKRIDVRLSEQVVIAYEEDRPVMMTRAATGAKFSQKDLSTPIGRYFTNYKFPSKHMVHPDRLEENAYDLPGVPWVSFLTTNGVAFHGTYWHNDYGKPRSHGCINLNLATARWLFRWTLPTVPLTERTWLTRTGTIVDIF
jgi:lipoprotein-anchoring transpeptidase ErfK/SrfK